MSDSIQRSGGWALFLLGFVLDGIGVFALFNVDQHDGSIVVILVLGTLLMSLGRMFPHLEGEFELGPKGLKARLRKLRRDVEEAEKTTPQTEEAGRKKVDGSDSKTISEEIIKEAAKSPSAALVHLSLHIEKEVRLLLAKTNWLSPDAGLSFNRVIKFIKERKFFSPPLISSLELFWKLRSSIIHDKPHGKTSDEQIVSAIDIGLTILKMIESIPHEINIVYHPGVPVYTDTEGKIKIENVLGLILDTTSPGRVKHEKRVFPTRRNYKKGQQLSWEWNFDSVWQQAWYRDPDTKEMKSAWGASAEFIGRPLEEVVPRTIIGHLPSPS